MKIFDGEREREREPGNIFDGEVIFGAKDFDERIGDSLVQFF